MLGTNAPDELVEFAMTGIDIAVTDTGDLIRSDDELPIADLDRNSAPGSAGRIGTAERVFECFHACKRVAASVTKRAHHVSRDDVGTGRNRNGLGISTAAIRTNDRTAVDVRANRTAIGIPPSHVDC